MKPFSFGFGVAVALVLSLAGGALFSLLGLSFPTEPLLRFLVAPLGFAYVLALLHRSPRRAGKPSAAALYVLVSAASVYLAPSLLFVVLIHAALLWLIRSLHFHSRPLAALLDLALSALAVAAATWALRETQSVFAAFWSFFLVQSAAAVIPAVLRPAREPAERLDDQGRFELAHNSAEAALRRIGSNIPH